MHPRSLHARFADILRAFLPPHMAVSRRDMWLGSVGMAIGLTMTELMCRQAGWIAAPWFIAPMGATAMLVFFLPASPMAQPWPVVGGNLVSALVGTALYHLGGDGGQVAALAAAVATALMFALRCLHPPGAAVALTAVIGGSAIHRLDWGFALWPVGLNALCLVVLGLVLNNAAGRRYPHWHAQVPTPAHPLLPDSGNAITAQDLDASLASFDELLDVDREDLEEIVARAQENARRRIARPA